MDRWIEDESGPVIPGRYSVNGDGYIVELDEPRPIIRGGMGCMGGIALLAFGVPIGLLLGSVIMLVVIFAPWLIPVAIAVYLGWRWRGVVTSYPRGRKGK